MHRVSKLLFAAGLALWLSLGAAAQAGPACDKPVYLTLDTGHMGVADLIADILKRHQVKATFFAADERTQTGDGSLGQHWANWWRARGTEGHEFASHTLDHVYWRADLAPAGGSQEQRFRVRPSSGAQQGRDMVWEASAYCAQIDAAAERLKTYTGRQPLPVFRAPGGRTSAALLASARQCGYLHVGWSDAGFLGDELPSERYSNPRLLQQALRNIRPGDVLMAHLGIWSRKDPWAPAVLEPLIVGLKERGFCFRTLREHPDYKDWIATRIKTDR